METRPNGDWSLEILYNKNRYMDLTNSNFEVMGNLKQTDWRCKERQYAVQYVVR